MHPKLEAIKQILPGLSTMLGCRHEVILHDLSHIESSIVELHGNVTNRKTGGPATNYLLQLLKEHGNDAPDHINYQTQMPDGRMLRSSTIFIRDEQGCILGSLCINKDMTDYMVAMNVLQEETYIEGKQEQLPMEYFAREISEVMEAVVDREVNQVHKPVAYMQKEDKLAVVLMLEKKGIFDIKNSVEYIAERLGVSSFTIYNYLKEIRGRKANSAG